MKERERERRTRRGRRRRRKEEEEDDNSERELSLPPVDLFPKYPHQVELDLTRARSLKA